MGSILDEFRGTLLAGAVVVVVVPTTLIPIAVWQACIVSATGFVILVAGRIARIEINDESITQYDIVGRVVQRFKWSEIDHFHVEEAIRVRNPRYRNQNIVQYKFCLTSDHRALWLTDNIAGWDRLRQEILNRIPESAKPVETGRKNFWGWSADTMKRWRIAARVCAVACLAMIFWLLHMHPGS